MNMALTAHHGTPHKVDKFTTAKIGTGEGAQVAPSKQNDQAEPLPPDGERGRHSKL